MNNRTESALTRAREIKQPTDEERAAAEQNRRNQIIDDAVAKARAPVVTKEAPNSTVYKLHENALQDSPAPELPEHFQRLAAWAAETHSKIMQAVKSHGNNNDKIRDVVRGLLQELMAMSAVNRSHREKLEARIEALEQQLGFTEKQAKPRHRVPAPSTRTEPC